MDTGEGQKKCIICGSVSIEGEVSRKKGYRLLRLWKYECAETVCCILFKHKIRNLTLLNHFRRASYCSSCQQGIRDINLTWKLQKSLKAKIKRYSESTKKLIKSNYDNLRNSSEKDSEGQLLLSDYDAVITKVYREACVDDTPGESHPVRKIEAEKQVKAANNVIGEPDDHDNGHDSYFESPNCDILDSSSQKYQKCVDDVHEPNNSDQESLKESKISCKKKRCRQKFLDELEMETHFLEKHSSNRGGPLTLQTPKVACPKCGKMLRDELYLKDHIKKVHDKRPRCKFCWKLFPNEEELLIHCSSFHQLPNPFSCAFCDVQCFSTTELRKHTGEVHPDPDRLKCETCGKIFKTLHCFLIHERMHTDPSILKTCEFCGKLFANKNQLNLHLTTHNTELNFLCSTCGKAFKSQKSLGEHLRVHDPSRTFSCVVCEKSFKSLAGCRIHETSHTGIKPHKCSICDKSFLNKYNMLAHEKIHAGDYKKRVRNPKSNHKKKLTE